MEAIARPPIPFEGLSEAWAVLADLPDRLVPALTQMGEGRCWGDAFDQWMGQITLDIMEELPLTQRAMIVRYAGRLWQNHTGAHHVTDDE